LKDAEAGLKAQESAHPASSAWEAKVGAILRATILLEEHRPAYVAAVLEVARPYEGTGLDSRYLRARGYAESGQQEKAVSEFQRLLAAKAMDPVNADVPIAELGLARCLVSLHRPEQARGAYATFLAARAHADPDLKVLVAAKREAAELEEPQSRPLAGESISPLHRKATSGRAFILMKWQFVLLNDFRIGNRREQSAASYYPYKRSIHRVTCT